MKTYCISHEYVGNVTGERGIVPINIQANNAQEAVDRLVEKQEGLGYKVLGINAVYQYIRAPHGGWLVKRKEKEDVNRDN